MDGDLSGILLALTGAAGLIVLFDFLVLKKRRAARAAIKTEAPAVVRQARGLFPVLLAVVLFRSFLFEPFRIPSASMMPGLIAGDFIVVSKFTYGLRLPQINWKIVSIGEPQRGDVVVFRSPSRPINLIKRLVGLPGDHVVVRENRVTINGVAAPVAFDGAYTGEGEFAGSAQEKEWFGTTAHVIMFAKGGLSVDFDGIVPPGHYFFMGDNRNDSADSRFAEVGFVPDQLLVGRAVRIWMNWQVPEWPQLNRIGQRIE